MKKILFIFCLLIFCSSVNAQSLYSDSTKIRAIKFDFFSPVNGCLGLSLETVKTKVFSYDLDAGFIGMNLGDYYYYDAFVGAYGGAGFRFYFSSEYKKAKNYNIFEGVYIKPSLSLAYYHYKKEQINLEDITGTDFSISQFVYFGSQTTAFDVIVFDFWFGFGYGKNWISEKNPNSEFTYNDGFHDFGHRQLGDSPLLFDAGFSLGYIF
jgi:hypothetical protein